MPKRQQQEENEASHSPRMTLLTRRSPLLGKISFIEVLNGEQEDTGKSLQLLLALRRGERGAKSSSQLFHGEGAIARRPRALPDPSDASPMTAIRFVAAGATGLA